MSSSSPPTAGESEPRTMRTLSCSGDCGGREPTSGSSRPSGSGSTRPVPTSSPEPPCGPPNRLKKSPTRSGNGRSAPPTIRLPPSRNDLGEPGEHNLHDIYGRARYDRLVAIKRAWDPDNVFRLN